MKEGSPIKPAGSDRGRRRHRCRTQRPGRGEPAGRRRVGRPGAGGRRRPGGAVQTAELTAPGFRNDLFSAFYPLGAASPIIRALELEDHGLRWVHAPAVLAHVLPGRPVCRDLAGSGRAARSRRFAPGDGDAWRAEFAQW